MDVNLSCSECFVQLFDSMPVHIGRNIEKRGNAILYQGMYGGFRYGRTKKV